MKNTSIKNTAARKFIPTIGLEIHAELRTKSKMFCSCVNDPDEDRPNVNICPICMGHPGTLPVINKEAVKHVLKVGLAVGGRLADFTEWDRKNYFYPDIPKGYQISQYKYPLVEGGAIAVGSRGGVALGVTGTIGAIGTSVAITRIHLEEDTAQSTHDAHAEKSLVNFNRAGVPLMELVTEPVIHDAETAVAFAKELQLLLRYLGVGEANMEKGEMRVEANVSVASEGDTAAGKFGVKTEVKNLNSFRAVERAISYEIDRQTKILEGETQGTRDAQRAQNVRGRGQAPGIVQETRGWDDTAGKTFSQRAKESSHDYRYFPDPDIPKLKIRQLSDFSEVTLREELPELPWTLRARLVTDFAMTEKEAAMFVESIPLYEYFKKVLAAFPKREGATTKSANVARLTINYLSSDYVGLLKKEYEVKDAKELTENKKDEETRFTYLTYLTHLPDISPLHFAQLIILVAEQKITSRGAKDILAILLKNKKTDGKTDSNDGEENGPETIALKNGLIQKTSENEVKKIQKMIDEIVTTNPTVVADYTKGKKAALQYLVGQGMKMSRGSANPEMLQKLFVEKIG